MEELLTDGSLNFAHDLIIWDRLPTFIFGDDLRFLVDFLLSRNTEHDVSEAAAVHVFVCFNTRTPTDCLDWLVPTM